MSATSQYTPLARSFFAERGRSSFSDAAPNPGNPGTDQPGQVVGVGAFSSGLRGLRLAPAKQRYLVPPTSG
jgi:hypothetical protein